MSKQIIVAACAAIAVAACASDGSLRKNNDSKLEYADYAGEPIESFTSFGLDGWNAVSRNKLVVEDGVSKAYLITVWDSCRDLQFADAIAISSTTRTVTKMDKVLVAGESCPITEIRPIDVKHMKADRRAQAEAAKAAAKPNNNETQ
jgi:hypothetical protein